MSLRTGTATETYRPALPTTTTTRRRTGLSRKLRQGWVAASNGLPAIAFGLLALALVTEYRVRIGMSATIPEFFADSAIGLCFLQPTLRRLPTHSQRWILFLATLVSLLLARAVALALFRTPDTQSVFSHARDEVTPVLVVVAAHARLRLSRRTLTRIQWMFVASGVVAAVLGINQFFFGKPYLFVGASVEAFTRYKTEVAHQYLIATLLDHPIDNLARGLYGFPIAYAAALSVPCLFSFALALRGPRLQRVIAGIASLLMYVGIYFSFSRSVIMVVPIGWVIVYLTVHGRFRPALAVVVSLSYVAIAFLGPRLQLAILEQADMGTLTSRADSVLGYVRMVQRDPAVLIWGSTLSHWQQWETLAPHNWIVNTLLTDGVAATVVRLGLYVSLFRGLFPWRSNDPMHAARAGLWCGAFVLVFVTGQTEPFSGISEFLMAGFALALLALGSSHTPVAVLAGGAPVGPPAGPSTPAG